MAEEFFHHSALKRGHDTVEIIHDLFLCCFEIMGNYLFLIQLILFSVINGFTSKQVFEYTAGTFAIDIGDCT